MENASQRNTLGSLTFEQTVYSGCDTHRPQSVVKIGDMLPYLGRREDEATERK